MEGSGCSHPCKDDVLVGLSFRPLIARARGEEVEKKKGDGRT